MDDFKQRLVSAIKASSEVITQALTKLTRIHQISSSNTQLQVYNSVNISDLSINGPTSTNGHIKWDTFAVIVYNPLGQERLNTTWVRIPITSDQAKAPKTVFVGEKSSSKINVRRISTSVAPISQKVRSMVGHHPEVTHELVFKADRIPALGYQTYLVTAAPSNLNNAVDSGHPLPVDSNSNYILKGKSGFKLVINHQTGETMYVLKNEKQHRLVQKFFYYQAHAAVWEICPTSGPIKLLNNSNQNVIHGAVYESAGYSELTQRVNDWIWQTVRVYHDRQDIEFDWVVGPLPEEGKINHEVITRFETDLPNAGTWYTDANGRQNVSDHSLLGLSEY